MTIPILDSMLVYPESMLVIGPAIAAVFLFAFGSRWLVSMVSAVVILITLAAGLVLFRIVTNGPYDHNLGAWGPPLGIVWKVDGLSGVMILLCTLVGAAVCVYSLAYFKGGGKKEGGGETLHFWPLWMMLWASLYALFLSHDIFNWYVTLELTSLSAAALITLTGSSVALRSAMRYLLLALFASLFYLAGVAILYAAYGVLDVESLRQAVKVDRQTGIALALMAFGLCVKTALFPLHFWLPPAHSSAPSPVSAILSALVVKGGFYILLRQSTDLFSQALSPVFDKGLGALGAAAILWGSLHAFRQPRLKMVVAYSTVAQLGYLFVIFPLMTEALQIGGDWASRAWAGGIYHLFSHGLAKASLFLAAGIIIHSCGDDKLETLKGLGDRMPVTVTGMALAGVGLMGIPPGGGFIAKWLLLTVAIQTGRWEWALVMIFGGLAAVGYLLRVFRRLMSGRNPAEFHSPPRSMEWMVLFLAVLSIFFGLSSTPLFSVLMQGAPAELGLYFKGISP